MASVFANFLGSVANYKDRWSKMKSLKAEKVTSCSGSKVKSMSESQLDFIPHIKTGGKQKKPYRHMLLYVSNTHFSPVDNVQ